MPPREPVIDPKQRIEHIERAVRAGLNKSILESDGLCLRGQALVESKEDTAIAFWAHLQCCSVCLWVTMGMVMREQANPKQ